MRVSIPEFEENEIQRFRVSYDVAADHGPIVAYVEAGTLSEAVREVEGKNFYLIELARMDINQMAMMGDYRVPLHATVLSVELAGRVQEEETGKDAEGEAAG